MAEALGWKKRRPEVDNSQWIAPQGGAWNNPPDYLNDLNDCQEFEAIIIKGGPKSIREYEDQLQKHVANIIFANAEQKSEAFLKTLKLWQD